MKRFFQERKLFSGDWGCKTSKTAAGMIDGSYAGLAHLH